MFDHEFCEDQLSADDRAHSAEDLQFLALMNKAAKKVDGHYLLPLPWKYSGISLPFIRSMALKGLLCLKRKFECSKITPFLPDTKTKSTDTLEGYLLRKTTNRSDCGIRHIIRATLLVNFALCMTALLNFYVAKPSLNENLLPRPRPDEHSLGRVVEISPR